MSKVKVVGKLAEIVDMLTDLNVAVEQSDADTLDELAMLLKNHYVTVTYGDGELVIEMNEDEEVVRLALLLRKETSQLEMYVSGRNVKLVITPNNQKEIEMSKSKVVHVNSTPAAAPTVAPAVAAPATAPVAAVPAATPEVPEASTAPAALPQVPTADYIEQANSLMKMVDGFLNSPAVTAIAPPPAQAAPEEEAKIIAHRAPITLPLTEPVPTPGTVLAQQKIMQAVHEELKTELATAMLAFRNSTPADIDAPAKALVAVMAKIAGPEKMVQLFKTNSPVQSPLAAAVMAEIRQNRASDSVDEKFFDTTLGTVTKYAAGAAVVAGVGYLGYQWFLNRDKGE